MPELSLDKLQVIMNLVFFREEGRRAAIGRPLQNRRQKPAGGCEETHQGGEGFYEFFNKKFLFFQRPQPKFDAYTLIGPKGLPALKTAFEGCKYNPKADPVSLLSVFFSRRKIQTFLNFILENKLEGRYKNVKKL